MFKIEKKSKRSEARLGTLSLSHGKVQTPVFMPIATRGTVKALSFADVLDLDPKLVLANTYHLFLRPGVATIKKVGGLNEFTNFSRPFLTDSGGYQVFSLAKLRKIDDSGVTFNSHIDGAKTFLSPEISLQTQMDFGVDIAMVLDDVAAYPATKSEAKRALERTTLWASRSKEYLTKKRGRKPRVFAIVQGSVYKDLRKKSAEELLKLDFDGYAIGGLSVGEPKNFLRGITKYTTSLLPFQKPRYLMGVGTPDDIVASVKAGVDMFDCVLPTRNARHGTLYVNRRWLKNGSMKYDVMRAQNAKYADDSKKVDPTCNCPTCKSTSRAYLRHLFSVGEPTAMTLATIHNVHFYLELMREIRAKIKQGKF